MNCPEVIIVCNSYMYLCRNGRFDYKSRRAPLCESLNIFRYEVIFPRYGRFRTHINKDGVAWLRISNVLYRLKVAMCRHDFGDRVHCTKCFKERP